MTNGVTTQDETTFISLLTSMKQHENLLKYNLNLIDELHADENAHTRIFIKLRSFEKNCQKVLLQCFLSQMNAGNNSHSKIPETIDDYEIYSQHDFIDAYFMID